MQAMAGSLSNKHVVATRRLDPAQMRNPFQLRRVTRYCPIAKAAILMTAASWNSMILARVE
jgi:hypothetical protein